MTESRAAPVSPLRVAVHMGTGLFALLLGVLPAPWHLVAAGLGVLTGWVVFPLTGLDAKLRRPGESWWGGLRTYPLAVLGLVLLLSRTQAAAAWGVLALGDGMAALVGSRVPSPRLLGHAKLTLSGTGAYVVFGSLGALGLSQAVAALDTSVGHVGAGHPPGLLVLLLATGAAAASDALRIPPYDNRPAALAAGAVLTTLG